MAELKTKETDVKVEEFLNSIADDTQREDSKKVSAMMEKATDADPKMYGANIVGFGKQILKYASRREQEWMQIGFSPRKSNLTLYLTYDENWDEDLLSKLGKHKLGKGCLYFKKLSDVDEKVLEQIIEKSVENIRGK
jgi:Domain of unknown function (DU1801)